MDDEPVQLWQPHLTPKIPTDVKTALTMRDVQIAAWNATFERTIFEHCLHTVIDYNRWIDPMVWARHLSLPGKLGECGLALGLPPDEGKIQDGKRLIRKFSMPYTMGGEPTLFGVTKPDFHDWDTSPDDWKLFSDYCVRDTEVERTLLHQMSVLPLPEIERRGWILDQKINNFGIPVGATFIKNALELAHEHRRDLEKVLKEKTGLKNPNSRDQLMAWAQSEGYPYSSMRKEFITAAIADTKNKMSDECRKVLSLRQDASKTSYKKYEAIQLLVGSDGRVRNQFLFMGASRTGRWSGTGFQPQNPPRPTKEVEKKYDRALELVLNADYQAIKNEFSSVIGVVTSCVRSAIQAPPGMKFDVCDLNAIENRVLGWVADCDPILQVFREGRCPYLSFATKIYNVPYDTIAVVIDGIHKAKDKDASEKRQVAKPAVLGAGYGLGPGVMRLVNPDTGEVTYEAEVITDQYGNTVHKGLLGYAENMGVKLTPEQAYSAWAVFRESYPKVVQFWRDLEKAAFRVLKGGKNIRVGAVVFDRIWSPNDSAILRIMLPSGRALHYLNARTEIRVLTGKDGNEYEKPALVYDGIGHGVGKMGEGWGKVYTYGGKLAENIVQAISRDILLNAMFLADDMGAEIVLHAHDEIMTVSSDSDPFAFSLNDLRWCMTAVPQWAPGLPLQAEGYTGKFYRKG